MRVATGSDFDIVLNVRSNDILVDADATPTITLLDKDGETVSTGAVSAVSTGIYKSKIDARSAVEIMTVTWEYEVDGYATTDSYAIHVDGGYLFRLDELRAMKGLDDQNRFPLEDLRRARDEATTFINDFTQMAFVETFAKQTSNGDNRSTIYLMNGFPVRALSRVTVNGVVKDTSTWSVSAWGRVAAPSSWTGYRTIGQGVQIHYTYGFVFVPPDIKRAALRLCQHWLLDDQGSIPDRARMVTTQWGTYQLTMANDEYPTGIPTVDAVLRRYRLIIPSFA